MLPRLSVFPALLLLAACGTIKDSYNSFLGGVDNTEPPTPLVEFEQRADIDQLWDAGVGSGTDQQYLKLVPVHADGHIYVAEIGGDITAFDARTGEELWETDTDTRITGGPGAGESMVLVGTGEAEVLALAAESGEILWRTRVSSEVLSTPKISDNIIVARTVDGKIAGLNAETGERIWVYDRTVPVLSLRGTSSPVITGNFVLAGFDGGRLAAIELSTGKPVWETRVALGSGRTELERMVDIDAEPVVRDDVVYVATFQGRVAAMSLETGQIQWARDISSYAGLCVDSTTVYVTDDNSHIWALDRFTGSSIWKQEKLQARAITAPARIGDLVVVADLEGYLHWLDTDTGDLIARSRISDSPVIAAPLSVDNIVYGYASDGTLGAYTYDNLSEKLVADTDTDQEPETVAEDDTVKEETAEPEQTEEDESWSFWDFFSSDDEIDDDLTD